MIKIVTIGGGSSYTPELIEGILKRYHIMPVSELWLDRKSTRLNSSH